MLWEENFPIVDMNRVAIMGHSGGGAAAYYSAALEPRIKAIIASCSVCSFEKSIAVISHCVCNHIPNMLRFFETGDIAGLIAPKPMVIAAGMVDPIFPIDGVRDAYALAQKWYEENDAKDALRLVVGDGGHSFYTDIAWDAFMELTNW